MSAPLRVLSIATLFPDATRPNFGIFVERSLAALAGQPGIDLTIAAPIGLPPWPLSRHPRYATLATLPLEEQWHGLSVLRPRFALIPGRWPTLHAPMIARAVARAIRDLPPFDVIDAQFFHPDGAAAAQLAARLGLPCSIKARGSDIAVWGQRADTGAQIRSAAAAAGGLLAVSRSLREEMAGIGIDPTKITIHYTGIDAARFRPIDRALARQQLSLDDGPVLLTVGTLMERKGQRLVLDALPSLPGVTYCLAGTGPAEADYRARAEALGVADRVRFLGSVANADLPALYSAADIMVLPSMAEGLANAWVEALACGTPLLLADIPPAHEVIDAPDAGQIVPADSASITNAVREMLASAPDRASLSARTHARFSWERNGAELAAHLRALTGKD